MARTRGVIAGTGLVLALMLAHVTAADAHDFPSKPIRLIVPFAPGGPSDISARVIAEELRKEFGQPVIVENKPGAGAIVATQALLRAPADGYTLMMASNSLATSKWLYKHLPYDPLSDLQPIIGVTRSPLLVLVPPVFPGDRIHDLIRAVATRPGKVAYASAGAGTLPHLAGELLKQRFSLDMTHVPYRGSGPALIDLMAGQVQVYLDIVLSAQSHVTGGSVKALGVTTKTRLEEFPDIPTLDEQGVKDCELTSWFGIVTRAGVPDAVVAQLNAVIDKVLQTTSVRARFSSMGAVPIGGQPDAFKNMIQGEYRMWGPVISAAGISLD